MHSIRVNGIWKRYLLGQHLVRSGSLKEFARNAVLAPVRALRRNATAPDEAARPGWRDSIWALRDVSFEVKPGEVVAIVGRNGAGKSSLFRVLSRITAPTKGRIELRGRLASLMEVGIGFHPQLTGRENIFLSGAMFGMRRQLVRRQFDSIVAYAEIEKFLDTPVKHYSSGMYARLAFSVAAHLEPDILLVDEILAVGDSAFQQKCLGTLKDGSRNNRTVLFVSHNMQIVRSLCTRLIHIENGTVLMDAPIDEGVTAYNKFLQKPRDLKDAGLDNRTARSTGAIQIASFAVKDTEGLERWRFHPGDAVEFELGLVVAKPVPDLGVELAIRSTLSGETISTVFHPLSRSPLPAGTRYAARLRLPRLPLLPGDYALRLTLKDLTQGRTLDVIDENVGLSWLSIDPREGTTANQEGYVFLDANAELKKAA